MRVLQKQVVKDKKTYTNFYLELDNGVKVAFKPSFVNDYGKLRGIAERFNDEEKQRNEK